jgi:membrane protein DedA with SNARE-associated domain
MSSFIKYYNELPDFLIYISLALASFVENLIPPVPGDMITVFGAFLVGTGRLNFVSVYITTTFGSLLGFICLYWIGGAIGRRFFLKKDYRLFTRSHILRAETWFKEYGYFIILINRFLPGIRSVISITAGISGLNTNKVLMLSLLSAALWNILWIFLGITLGHNWSIVEKDIRYIFSRYNIAIFILFSVTILVWIIKWVFFNKNTDDNGSINLDT